MLLGGRKKTKLVPGCLVSFLLGTLDGLQRSLMVLEDQETVVEISKGLRTNLAIRKFYTRDVDQRYDRTANGKKF